MNINLLASLEASSRCDSTYCLEKNAKYFHFSTAEVFMNLLKNYLKKAFCMLKKTKWKCSTKYVRKFCFWYAKFIPKFQGYKDEKVL